MSRVSVSSRVTVFVSGSRGIRALPAESLAALDRIIEQGFRVVVGDAYGVDRLVQIYLAGRRYTNVVVFYAGPKPRNLMGKFKIQRAAGNQESKDIAMTQLATYGLAVWDGHSAGTAANINRLQASGKKVKVIKAVSPSTTLFCRAGVHESKFHKGEYYNHPIGLHSCHTCLVKRTPEELAEWDGHPPCPTHTCWCEFAQAVIKPTYKQQMEDNYVRLRA